MNVLPASYGYKATIFALYYYKLGDAYDSVSLAEGLHPLLVGVWDCEPWHLSIVFFVLIFILVEGYVQDFKLFGVDVDF